MSEKYIDMSMKDFSDKLASKESMPGGGSAAAYSLSLSNSLASMVANFTTGKKKYAQYEKDICQILKRTEELSGKILSMVDEDAKAFLPLAATYKLPEDTVEQKNKKREEMQKCLKNAAEVPMELLKTCSEVLNLHESLLEKGSRMLISDVGVGVSLLKSAAESAKLNILININSVEDCGYVDKMKNEMEILIEDISKRSEIIYKEVAKYVGE